MGFRDKVCVYPETKRLLFILLHVFRRSDDLTASVIADTNRCKDGDILDLAAPAAL